MLSQTITVPTFGQSSGFTAIQNYTYDELNRLKSATETTGGSQSWKQTFTFDRYGNRNFNETNTSFDGFTKLCNSNTELCAELRKKLNPSINTSNNRFSSGQDYSYDSSGNTTTDANGQTFTYDAENKQVLVTNGSGTVGQYWYDGDGKRIKKYVPGTGETTIFVYDSAGKLVAEYALEISQTPQVSYLTSDHLGSPRILTEENGNIISRRDFRPFGEEIVRTGYGQDTIREKFATYRRDVESGLDYAQARYYSSNLGRFFSIDPYNADAQDHIPQSWNAYSYARNNPLKYGDPSGEGVEVCTTSGERQCTYFTEPQWKEFLRINKESDQFKIDGNKVTWGGETVGIITSSTMLDERQTEFIQTTASESKKKGKVVGALVAAAVVVGACIGACPAAGAAVATRIGARITANILERAVERVVSNPNILNKIFASKHLLDPLVRQLGSQRAVVAAVVNALAGKLPADGVFRVTVTVAGRTIEVQGRVMDGVVKVNDFWIPK